MEFAGVCADVPTRVTRLLLGCWPKNSWHVLAVFFWTHGSFYVRIRPVFYVQGTAAISLGRNS